MSNGGLDKDKDMGADVTLVETVLPTADATREVGRNLGAQVRAGDVIVLVGELGAGKTTLTQGLAEGMKVRGPITSPTFVISRVHPSLVEGPALVHADAYRLSSAAELDDIDPPVPTSVTVGEWGAAIAEQLSASWLAVDPRRRTGDDGADDALDADDPREIRVIGHGPRWSTHAD